MHVGEFRQAWDSGVALGDAWLFFAAEAARAEHENKPGFSGTIQQLLDIAGSTSRDGKLLLSTLQKVGKAHLDQMESVKLLQDALIDVIARQELLAVGIGPEGALTPIDPSAFFETAPDWENSRIQVNGALYERVRVADPVVAGVTLPPRKVVKLPRTVKVSEDKAASQVEKEKRSKKAATAKGKGKAKAGGKAKAPPAMTPIAPVEGQATPAPLIATVRPAAAVHIRAAIARLMEEDAELAAMTRRSAAQKVRETMGTTYEKGNGLSDPNLARHLRRECGPRMRKERDGVPDPS
jgi:hypothetical protein